MKNKIFSIAMLSLLSMIILASAVSAAVDLTLTSPLDSVSVNPGETVTVAFTISVTDEDATNFDWSASSVSNAEWTTLPTLTALTVGESQSLTAILTINDYFYGTISDANIHLDYEDSSTHVRNMGLDEDINVVEYYDIAITNTDTEFTCDSTECSRTITVSNEGNQPLTEVVLTQSGDFDIEFDTNNFALAVEGTQEVLVTTSNDEDNFLAGNSVKITATSGDVSADTTLSFDSVDFCEYDNSPDYCNVNDYLEIKDLDYEVIGFGDDDDLYAFDTVEVEVEVEAGDYDLDDVTLEWGLYDLENEKWTIDLDEEDDFNLDDGESNTIKFSFTIDDDMDEDLDDLTDGTLRLYVRVNAQINDNDADDDLAGLDDSKVCASETEDFSLTMDDFVLLQNIEVAESVSCGNEFLITADVWNIGDDEEEDVSVIIYNKELGINKKVEVGNIDAFDSEDLEVYIDMPENAEEGEYYQLTIYVYDEDGDLFEIDDEESVFSLDIKAEGSCSTVPKVSVSTSLESDAFAGEEIVVKVTVTNLGSTDASYTLSTADYSEWAELVSVDKESFDIAIADSEEITITLKANADISGEQKFTILVNEGNLVFSKPVSIVIETPSIFSGLTGLSILGEGNTHLWIIGALNAVLVIAIIGVAVKMAKKKE